MFSIKLDDAWNYFLNHLQQLGRSAHTVKQYEIDGRQLIDFLSQKEFVNVDYEVSEFSKVLYLYRKYLIQSDFSVLTINRKLSSIRSFIRFLHVSQWIEIDFSNEIELLKKPKKKLRIVSIQEANLVKGYYKKKAVYVKDNFGVQKAAYWTNVRNDTIVNLLLFEGLKLQEVVNLKAGHLLLDEGCLFIHERGGVFRKINLSKESVTLLRHYMIETEREVEHPLEGGDYVFFGTGRSPKSGLTCKTIERVIAKPFRNFELKNRGTSIRYRKVYKDSLFLNKKEMLEKFGYTRFSTVQERVNRMTCEVKK